MRSGMKQKGHINRERIVQAADDLFYQRGYNQTSFSDIADAAEVPRGNFYYYFKTKDDILKAVVDHRLEGIRALLASWEDELPGPRECLKRYVQIMRNEEKNAVRYGCPMGSLSAELAKTRPDLKEKTAQMFEVMREFLQRQLVALGHAEDAENLSMHLLARVQGAVLVANVYDNKAFLRAEADQISAWIDTL